MPGGAGSCRRFCAASTRAVPTTTSRSTGSRPPARTRRCSRGAWLPEGEFGAGAVPVATFASFDKTLNAGLELVPLRMITEVTTSPAHRRRGLVRRLMEDDLADAVARGIPVAALTASEATIYGRWGFGAATFAQKVEVDTGPRFGLRAFTDPGRVELIEPPESWSLVKDVFERFHASTRGSVAWPSHYEQILTGTYDFDAAGPDKLLRGVVHLDADGNRRRRRALQVRRRGRVQTQGEGRRDDGALHHGDPRRCGTSWATSTWSTTSPSPSPIPTTRCAGR